MKKQLETKKKAQKIFDKSAALIPLAIQEFSQLRNEGCIYIDKTKSILKMLSLRRVYFLSRPRRFGKSLLISTLDSLFRGEKQLFKGLYIYDKWDWSETYNVIRLDFTLEAMSTPQELRDGLAQTLNDIAAANAITLNSSSLPKIFFELIKKLYELNGRQIVILVDEYDLPILDNLDGMKETSTSIAVKKILGDFYRVLKGANQYLRFVFLTGVTRIAGLSIFSGLNNITDISLDDNFCDICGYTQSELENTFAKYIKDLARKENITYEQTLDQIKRFYNGYTWDGKTAIYNPFSTLNLFSSLEFNNSWFYSGSCDFLIDYFKKNKIDEGIIFNDKEIDVESLRVYDNQSKSVYALLFQTGYMTIKKKWKNDLAPQCLLSCPNFEVQHSFGKQIALNILKGADEDAVLRIHNTIKNSIETLDAEALAKTLHAAFHFIPNKIKRRADTAANERFYHSHLAILLAANGFMLEGESSSGLGNADIVILNENFTLVCEIKYSADISKAKTKVEEALMQIKEKQYYAKYTLGKNNRVILLGLVFAAGGKKVKCKLEEILF